MMHGGIAKTVSGPHGVNCQAYMAQFCAKEWNNVCEVASQDPAYVYPNNLQEGNESAIGLTAGETNLKHCGTQISLRNGWLLYSRI